MNHPCVNENPLMYIFPGFLVISWVFVCSCAIRCQENKQCHCLFAGSKSTWALQQNPSIFRMRHDWRDCWCNEVKIIPFLERFCHWGGALHGPRPGWRPSDRSFRMCGSPWQDTAAMGHPRKNTNPDMMFIPRKTCRPFFGLWTHLYTRFLFCWTFFQILSNCMWLSYVAIIY